MVDAKYTREIALNKRDAKYAILSRRITASIETAAKDGKFGNAVVINRNEYREETILTVFKHLRLNGYTLSVSDDGEFLFVQISWE